MLDLSTLDILIAMVIVILVLSLVVQSIQALAKKVLKLKSRQILNSLEDLFETITHSPAGEAMTGRNAPVRTPQELVAEVTVRLKEMGRETLFGKPMVDSLAKGDLLKILTRIKAEDLLPGTVGNFQTVLRGIQQLKDELAKIETTLLPGEASARFAAMQGSMMPLVHDLEALASGGNIDPAVFFGDLYRLRQIKAAEVLDILGQVQRAVSQELAAAQTAIDEAQRAQAEVQQSNDQDKINSAQERFRESTDKLRAMKVVDTGLKKIADQIATLSTAFDAAFAPLFARLQQVDVWYDTVMQGFDERYTRHMRTVALIISIGVVVALNANFFSIYRAIKSDPLKTALIVGRGPAILKTAQQENAGTVGVSPAPATPESPITMAEVKLEGEQVDNLVRTYESFGIKPLSRQQVYDAFSGNYSWRDLNETFVGWAIMVMLLSTGAPFWEDTLESLFGLKNLLRQKSDTKNIEEGKGGQPKP